MTALSVIIPNYNHAQYVGDQIHAVLDQDFREFQLILIDDASTDNSIEVIESAIGDDPRVKFIRNPTNQGALPSFEIGLKHATGKYLYLGGADDLLLQGFFSKSISMLERFPQAGLCTCDPGVLKEEQRKYVPLKWSEEPTYLSPMQIAERLNGGFIWGIGTIIRKDAFLAVGGYRPELRWHCDWFAWLAAAFRYGICYIPGPLAAMRARKESFSNSGRRDWTQQKVVIENIMATILSAEFRDILPYFVHSNAINHFKENNELARALA